MTHNSPDRAQPPPHATMLRRALFLMAVCGIVAFIVLAIRLFDLQILQHERLESAAVEQQLRETRLTASRGTITDRRGTILAQSATSYTIYLSPAEIRMYNEDKALIASGLAELLGADASRIETLAGDTSSWYKTVARKVEREVADAVRDFKTEHELHGVKIETDTRRYYPCGSLAAHVIGFTGTDNTGLAGLEYALNRELTGVDGSVQRLKSSAGTDMIFAGYESYRDARDGADIQLTLDAGVQYLLKKHLEQAVLDYDVENGAAAIAVDPQTGGILGMVSLGDFDLNDYQRISPAAQSLADACTDEEERATLIAAAQQKQWRNKAVSDTYEPGSTFKIMTLAIALEEGLVNESSAFFCGGNMNVTGRGKPLKCWKTAGHGAQTLTQAAQHSCNVAFATIGLRIGEETFYKYCEAFGFFESSPDSSARLTGRTGIALPGESGSIWWSRDVFCNPENLSQLAAASFGQTFNITPLQLIMAVSACCNGGYLLEPRLVESVTDADGNTENYEPVVVRQVVSESTSAKVNAILEQVVCDRKEGTGRNAYVAGYRIAGKTGTSEKVAQDVSGGDKEYIVSFVGYAPADAPRIAVLILLDTPSNETGIYISGGQMAAPVVGRFLSEALPALGVEPHFSAEEAEVMDKTVPDLAGQTLAEAAAQLKSAGLRWRAVGTGDAVASQLPRAGSAVAAGSAVLLFTDGESAQSAVTVPELAGLRYETARALLEERGLYLAADNSALAQEESVYIVSQDAPAGSEAARGEIVRVTLSYQDEGSYGRY